MTNISISINYSTDWIQNN